MIQLEQRIFALNRLGEFLRNIDSNDPNYDSLFDVISKAKTVNGWFSRENVLYAFSQWGESLSTKNLSKWTQSYTFEQKFTQTIGLILAGNIPLVGFHDVLSVLISGHKVLIKCSSSDPLLIPFLVKKLQEFEPDFTSLVEFTSERFKSFDAIIATGSNNAARYFEYYFSKVPNLIRSNRNGIAILDGSETKEQLEALAKDIVQYYGLGCRSTAKIFVPNQYDLNLIFGALYPYSNLMDSEKYANNYDYNKAVYLMSQFDILDNGFFVLKEDSTYSSPVACLHYEYFENLESLEEKLTQDQDQIQCITSNQEKENHFAFGEAQHPKLWDYADGKNTLDFLTLLS